MSADDATAFAINASGAFTMANLTGPNRLLKYNLRSHQFDYDVSMTSIQNQILSTTGKHAAGFQDACFDDLGNAYMLGSFGSVIAKVTSTGDNVTLWYHNTTAADPTEEYGFTGLFFHVASSRLIVSDARSQGLVSFDTSDEYGIPRYITPEALPANYTLAPDGLHAPSKYKGQIALMADNVGQGLSSTGIGGVTVFGSRDQWASAQFLGFVSNDFAAVGQALTTSAVQIANSIYLVTQYFQDPLEPSSWAKKSKFPFVDVTNEVERIVREWGGLE